MSPKNHPTFLHSFITAHLHSLIKKLWYGKFWLRFPLLPLTYLYLLLIKTRAQCYRFNVFKTQRFPLPVIVVGNITVGGTGKTPLVMWLVELLIKSGCKPAIISRGYKSKIGTPYLVKPTDDAQLVGDEPLLLARKCNVPVMIGANRSASVTKILAETNCNLIISDDGLQHYGLARNIEIVVLDGVRRLGNGYCLPAGPLREPKTRLETVDFVIVNGDKPKLGEYSMTLKALSFYNLTAPANPVPLNYFNQKTVHAVAAIGNPERFFNSLRALKIKVIEHPFPDHYAFSANDFAFGDNLPVIMTEKDTVKCIAFANPNWWALSTVPQLQKGFATKLQKLLGDF